MALEPEGVGLGMPLKMAHKEKHSFSELFPKTSGETGFKNSTLQTGKICDWKNYSTTSSGCTVKKCFCLVAKVETKLCLDQPTN